MAEPFPKKLNSVEFIHIRFRLEFQEAYLLSPESVLRLRRELRKAGEAALGTGPEGKESFIRLFDPPLSPDPAAVRRYQKPGPPFVILPPQGLPRNIEAGDELNLQVVFWGAGIYLLVDFVRILRTLGAWGWHRGEGRFEVAGLDAADPSGCFSSLWRSGMPLVDPAPPVVAADWWLKSALSDDPPLRLEFMTPARLLSGGRPLFHPTFAKLFPFILRRVTSLVHACCSVDLLDDPLPYLRAAEDVVCCNESPHPLKWRDWRTLVGEEGSQDLGGIVGSVLLEGGSLEEIGWILRLGTFMNLGKGASFGAGNFRLY